MKNPTSFEAAWTEAEASAFAALCMATGTESNRDAYLGRNPGVLNAWHFEPAAVDVSTILNPDCPSIYVPCIAEWRGLKRDRCQTWAMRLLGNIGDAALTDTNIANLRVREIGKPAYELVDVANEEKKLGVWSIAVAIDLVFSTGNRANRAGV
jgi:hypothetical protein